MSILDYVRTVVGDLPESFDYKGRRYPLQPVYDHIDTDSDAEEAVLKVVLESEAVQDEERGIAPPTEPAGPPPLPERLFLRATGARFPDRVGSGEVDPILFGSFLRGSSALNFDSKVWFDCTPEPDTVKAHPKLLGVLRWVAELEGKRFSWLGDGTNRIREDGVIVANGEGVRDFGFDGGVFKRDYARSNGYHAPVKLTHEGEYFIWTELLLPTGKTLTSNVIGPLRAS